MHNISYNSVKLEVKVRVRVTSRFSLAVAALCSVRDSRDAAHIYTISYEPGT